MKKKKHTCTLIIAILILTMVMVGVDAETQPKLFVDPPTYTATLPDEVFTININLANVTDLSAFEFKLAYNTTLLDIAEVIKGPFPPESTFTAEIHESEGYVWVLSTCVSATGSGTLATITFNVTYAASASCALDLYDTALKDGDINPIYHEVEDGNYKFVVLEITVATNKPCYYQGQNVTIYGNLTLDGFLHQGLVALEVQDPLHVMVARTVQTGPSPPPGNITVVEVFPSDNLGYPKYSFLRGSVAYFTVTLRNDGTEWKYVRITVNAYDANMCPIPGVPSTLISVSPGIHYKILIAPILIPMSASVGDGTVYASAFTNWPHASGVPYCPEKSATFQIQVGGQGSGASGSGIHGNYNLSFKLNPLDTEGMSGNYTVYASSHYGRQEVTTNTTFGVKILADINDDEVIDTADVMIVIRVYSKIPGWEGWATKADVNGDSVVDTADVMIVVRVYSHSWNFEYLECS